MSLLGEDERVRGRERKKRREEDRQGQTAGRQDPGDRRKERYAKKGEGKKKQRWVGNGRGR